MHRKQVLNTINLYRERLSHLSITKTEYPHDKLLPIENCFFHALSHCNGMLDKMEEFVSEGATDEAFRWLGFIQGILWIMRIYTLKELRDHNRSTPPAVTK